MDHLASTAADAHLEILRIFSVLMTGSATGLALLGTAVFQASTSGTYSGPIPTFGIWLFAGGALFSLYGRLAFAFLPLFRIANTQAKQSERSGFAFFLTTSAITAAFCSAAGVSGGIVWTIQSLEQLAR